MSAEDIARLTRRLLRDHPQVIRTTSLPEYIFRQGEKRELILPNSNRMLPGSPHFYDGVDGVKTGYTREAGYSFTGTARRDGMRLITVVMGTDSKSRRFAETEKLLDFGFQNYGMKTLLKKGKPVPKHGKVALRGERRQRCRLWRELPVLFRFATGRKRHTLSGWNSSPDWKLRFAPEMWWERRGFS